MQAYFTANHWVAYLINLRGPCVTTPQTSPKNPQFKISLHCASLSSPFFHTKLHGDDISAIRPAGELGVGTITLRCASHALEEVRESLRPPWCDRGELTSGGNCTKK